MKSKSLKALAIVFFISGLYDAFGGFYYAFLVGADRSVSSPPTHPFYALFIASFLFCFAYLQFAAALNIRRYLFTIGVVIFGRIFYAVLFFTYLSSVEGFPRDFLPTAVIDLIWSALYIVLALSSAEIRLRELFIPNLSND
jgi:hypothetical protein